jgi:hypothetical protein
MQLTLNITCHISLAFSIQYDIPCQDFISCLIMRFEATYIPCSVIFFLSGIGSCLVSWWAAGRPDIFSTDENSNGMTVYLNNIHHPPLMYRDQFGSKTSEVTIWSVPTMFSAIFWSKTQFSRKSSTRGHSLLVFFDVLLIFLFPEIGLEAHNFLVSNNLPFQAPK